MERRLGTRMARKRRWEYKNLELENHRDNVHSESKQRRTHHRSSSRRKHRSKRNKKSTKTKHQPPKHSANEESTVKHSIDGHDFDLNRSFLNLSMDYDTKLDAGYTQHIFGYQCQMVNDDHLITRKDKSPRCNQDNKENVHQSCRRLADLSSNVVTPLTVFVPPKDLHSTSSGYMSGPSSNTMDVNMGVPGTPGKFFSNIEFEATKDDYQGDFDIDDIDGIPLEPVESGIVPYTPSIGNDYHEYCMNDIVYKYSTSQASQPSSKDFLQKDISTVMSERDRSDMTSQSDIQNPAKSKWDDTPLTHCSHNSSSTKSASSPAYLSDPQSCSTPIEEAMDTSYQFEMRSLETIMCKNIQDYQTLGWIAEGAFGAVYRAAEVDTGRVVAVKRVRLGRKLSDGQDEDNKLPLAVFREIQILWSCQHTNIVQMDSIAMGSSSDRVYIIMEYVENDMRTILKDLKQPFTTVELKSLMSDLLQGVNYLHENNIMHRDLKPANLLLSRDGVLKIADLGLAREDVGDNVPDDQVLLTPIVVTLWYRAPEVLLASKRYGRPVDLWSLGCILAEFVTRKALFPGRSDIDQVLRIFSLRGTPTEKEWPDLGDLPGMRVCQFAKQEKKNMKGMFQNDQGFISDCGFDLLDRFLKYDPKKRISVKDALEHEWFQEHPALETSLDVSGGSTESSVSWMGNFKVLMEKEMIKF